MIKKYMSLDSSDVALALANANRTNASHLWTRKSDTPTYLRVNAKNCARLNVSKFESGAEKNCAIGYSTYCVTGRVTVPDV